MLRLNSLSSDKIDCSSKSKAKWDAIKLSFCFFYFLTAGCSSSVGTSIFPTSSKRHFATATFFESASAAEKSSNKSSSMKRKVSSQGELIVPYHLIFEKTREVLKQENQDGEVRTIKKIAESDVVEYLQNNPEKLKAKKNELIKAVFQESKASKDPTKHLRLIPPQGMPGYSNLKVYVNHPYYLDKKLVPESNLVQVWNDFLKQAEKKIMVNVFDFDLQEIADTLAAKAKKGVEVTIGIDNETVEDRPEVKAVYDFLKKNRVNVVPVDSPKLNHQKMAVVDWDEPQTAKVLFSSGNLTQSCLGPEGDMKAVPASKRPKRSVPNANHVITMNSWLVANLLFNELTKTLDDDFHYRGSQYPILGSYQITGPGVDPQTFEAYPDESLIISFSPGGGFRDINKNIIGHFIKASKGPIRMIQFAFSSEDVTEALLFKAQEQDEKFDFMSVGDTPFAMQKWSQFLKMSGLVRHKNSSKESEFIELKENPFRESLGEAHYNKLRSQIKVAPWYYGASRKMKVDDVTYEVSGKIHHKVLSAGNFAIVGTSFNFSESAQKNNEQILVFSSKYLAQVVDGMTRWLSEESKGSVYEEALRRNSYVKNPEQVLPLMKKPQTRPSEGSEEEPEVENSDSTEAKQAG